MLTYGEFAITHILPTGECVAHDARGSEIRVRGAVPGDVVTPVGSAQRSQRRRDFVLVRPAPERREPPCSVQSACGGCALMPLEPEAQRRVKLNLLRSALAGFARGIPEIEWGDVGAPLAYRNRIRLRIEAGRIGFFNSAKRGDCQVLDPELVRALARLELLRERASAELSCFAHCELRAPDLDGRPGLALAQREDGPGVVRALEKLRELLPDFLIGKINDPDIPCQRRRLTGKVEALVPIDGFLQVNDAVNARLIEWVCAQVRSTFANSVLDLFAGAGNFSLPLAAAGFHVTAIERHGASVVALERAALRQGLRCEALPGSVEVTLGKFGSARRFDCVVVDAPRAGAGELLMRLPALGAHSVVLCSCYAPSFARDLAVLERAGYAVRRVVAWEMFGETHHLESVALFTKQ